MSTAICPSIPTSVPPVRVAARSQNSNVITINIPPQQPTIENCRSELQVNPQPLKLNVETSTDWPTVLATLLVGVGSIFTALLVGWLSYSNQRSQIQSTITNFRHAWMVELRQALSRFVALAAKINYENKFDSKYLHKIESNAIFSELMQMHTSVLLMLDADKDYTEELGMLMKEVEDALCNNDEDKFSNAARKLVQKSNSVLEGAWRDIKRDLQNPRAKKKSEA